MKKISAVIIIISVFSAAIRAAEAWAPVFSGGLSLTGTAWTSPKNADGPDNLPSAAANTVTPAAGTQGAAITQPVKVPAAVVKNAEVIDEGQEAYDSITGAAEFNYRPAYVENKYSNNELFQDIAVSAVEAVPFGFILAFLGIFSAEAAAQGSFQPRLKTLNDYTPVYAISIGSLAVLNIVINTLFFYDYN